MIQLPVIPRRILESPLGRRLAVGAVGTLVVRGLGAIATVATAGLLARLLGPHDYGIYAYAVSWTLLLGTIAGLGLDVLATREIAQARARGEPGTVAAFLRWSTRLVALSGTGAALLLAAAGFLLPDAWKPEAAAGLLYAAPGAAAIAGLRLLMGLLQGAGRVVLSQALQPLVLPVLVGTSAVLLHLLGRLDATTALFAYVLAGFAALALGLVIFCHNRASTVASSMVPTAAWRRSARTFALLNAATITHTQVGTLIIGTLTDPKETGLFDLAFKLSQLVPFTLLVISAPLAPIMAELWAKHDTMRLRCLYRTATLIAAGAALIVTVSYVTFLPWFPFVFGGGYADLTWPLLILCVGQLVYSACGPANLALRLFRDEFFVAIFQLFFLLIYIPVIMISSYNGVVFASFAISSMLTVTSVGLFLRVYYILRNSS